MKRQRTFAAIMQLLADRQWHNVQDLSRVTHFPDEWVRELLLEGRVEVSTEQETLASLVRLRPIAVNGTRSVGAHPSTTGVALGSGGQAGSWALRQTEGLVEREPPPG